MFQRFFSARKPSYPPVTKPRKKCDLVFFIAFSDGELVGIEDLLESFECYLDCSYEVVLANDCTTDGTAEKLTDAGHWFLYNPKKMGWEGNSFTIRRAAKCASELLDAPFYIKLDPDALMIQSGLLSQLTTFSRENPKAGLFGNYLFTPTGESRDFSHWENRMLQYQDNYNAPL
ncbi:hypothetical protein N9H39_00965 [Gammaproteobacteria bacterium]|nr:hypothetical protein [Gammaproteobacteria bacterium]